jgi:hypothetical protein
MVTSFKYLAERVENNMLSESISGDINFFSLSLPSSIAHLSRAVFISLVCRGYHFVLLLIVTT